MLKGVKLRDYQEQILRELGNVPSIGLFMKTGSGKTLTSLERFTRNPTSNLLVICPQKIVTQWFDEVEKHTDLCVCKYNMSWSSKKKDETISNFLQADIINEEKCNNCIVVNFDIITKMTWLDYVNKDWTIIIDESHKIKNMGTSRSPVKVTQKVLELGKQTPYKIILTATPTEKEYGGYIDLYSQLTFLGYLDMSYTLFQNRYCRIEKMQLPGMPFPINKITGYRMNLIDEEIKPLIKLCLLFSKIILNYAKISLITKKNLKIKLKIIKIMKKKNLNAIL